MVFNRVKGTDNATNNPLIGINEYIVNIGAGTIFLIDEKNCASGCISAQWFVHLFPYN